MSELNQVAARLGVRLIVRRANDESEIRGALSTFAQHKTRAVLVGASPSFNSRRWELITLAMRLGIPAIYELQDFAEARALLS